MPALRRTKAQQAKLNLAFLETASPPEARRAREAFEQAQSDREAFYEQIPTVMVMADGAKRDTFLLKRGAYDAPGEKAEPGIPAALGGPDVWRPALPGSVARRKI